MRRPAVVSATHSRRLIAHDLAGPSSHGRPWSVAIIARSVKFINKILFYIWVYFATIASPKTTTKSC